MAEEQTQQITNDGTTATVIKFLAAVLAAPKISAALAHWGIVQVDPAVLGAAICWTLHKLHVWIKDITKAGWL